MMKRIRLSRGAAHLPRTSTTFSPALLRTSSTPTLRRCMATTATEATTTVTETATEPHWRDAYIPGTSPHPSAALQSAKLAALHARLDLSKKIPLQTLARALVHVTAEQDEKFNNGNLAFLGSSILNYHVMEYIVCKWPRLPTSVAYETLKAYSGPDSLAQVAKRWGVEEAAKPGAEVDPGLLQWDIPQKKGSVEDTNAKWATERGERKKGEIWKRGMSSRVVMDDAFGEVAGEPEWLNDETGRYPYYQTTAYQSVVHAVIGAIYAHAGREQAKSFITSHILSRQFDPASIFAFKQPTRELSMLCAREGFEAPIARLESETGRLSRTPVFVVGVYSGSDKLGEGAGASLDDARKIAAMNALKSWYVYSVGSGKVRVPSDMMEEGAEEWVPPHIDPGEIV